MKYLILSAVLFASAALAQGQPRLNGTWHGDIGLPNSIKFPTTLHFGAHENEMVSKSLSRRPVPITVSRHGQKVILSMPALRSRLNLRRMNRGQSLVGSYGPHGDALPARCYQETPAKPAKNRPQQPQPPYSYNIKTVTLPGGSTSVTLAGTLTRPQGQGRFPAVVLIGGSGPTALNNDAEVTDRDETVADHKPFLLLADRLTRAGLAVLRFDQRCAYQSSCAQT